MGGVISGGRRLSGRDRATVIVAVALMALLYWVQLHSYLLFHTLAELFFIVVCLTVPIMAWSLRRFLDDDFAVFLGTSLVAVVALHLVHVVDYPHLGLISQSLDPPTQLWLSARFLLVVTFIAASFVVGRRVRPVALIVPLAAYFILVMCSIYWWHVFPVTLQTDGLTTFKKVAEYVLCALFVVAIVLLWRRRARLPYQSWRLLCAAIVVSIVAELLFSIYQTVSTWPNMMGHLLLVISALLMFRAVVDDGLARPHALLVTNLREAELLHHRLESSLRPALPVESQVVSVVTQYRPGDERLQLSGDFIDIVDRGDEGIAVICGDVSGHGPDAAALGAMLRASWQAFLIAGTDPVSMVEGLRAVLVRERKDAFTFATLSLAWIDACRDQIRLINVGHPVPLLIAGEVEPLPVEPIPPLGTFDVPLEEPVAISLPDGWHLFFYTDGLIEGRAAPDGSERFGEQRLIDMVRDIASQATDDGLEELLNRVEAAGGERFSDDVTVIVISKRAAPAPAGSLDTPALAAQAV
jgi:hypothetical protein